jgi:hypothetical protein
MYYCLPDVIEKMYKLGGNLNSIRTADGNSLLQKSIIANDSKTIEFILDHNLIVDFNHKNNKDESAIDTAEKRQSKYHQRLILLLESQNKKLKN